MSRHSKLQIQRTVSEADARDHSGQDVARGSLSHSRRSSAGNYRSSRDSADWTFGAELPQDFDWREPASSASPAKDEGQAVFTRPTSQDDAGELPHTYT